MELMRNALPIFTWLLLLAGCGRDGLGTIAAGDLASEYSRSKGMVRSKYDGKEIVVQGSVAAKAAFIDAEGGEGLIVIGEGRDPVKCRFTRREIERFSAVTEGENVTVTGVFNGELGTELRFCRLVGRE